MLYKPIIIWLFHLKYWKFCLSWLKCSIIMEKATFLTAGSFFHLFTPVFPISSYVERLTNYFVELMIFFPPFFSLDCVQYLHLCHYPTSFVGCSWLMVMMCENPAAYLLCFYQLSAVSGLQNVQQYCCVGHHMSANCHNTVFINTAAFLSFW